MKQVLLSVSIYFISVIALASGTYIGNGGDGYLTEDGKVYLADLYLAGEEVYETRFFTPVPYNRLDNSLSRMPFSTIEFPTLFLSSKINDIENISPGLGVLVKDVMRSYRWVFVDAELGPTPDVGGGYIDPSVSKVTHIQIANRHIDQIRISRKYWNMMSEGNRAALILHEVFYGLLKNPEESCDADPTKACSLTITKTRNLISLLFGPESMRLPPSVFANLILPKSFENCASAYLQKRGDLIRMPERTVAFSAITPAKALTPFWEFYYMEIPEAGFANVEKTAEAICFNLFVRPEARAYEGFDISFLRRPYSIDFQTGDLRIFERTMMLTSQERPIRSEVDCVYRFKRTLELWNSSLPMMPAHKDYQCSVQTPYYPR